MIAPGVPDQLSIDWVGPADHRAETEAVDRELVLRQIALTVLNQRLADQALKPGSVFVGAQAVTVRSLLNSGALTSIGVTTSPDKWQAALDASALSNGCCFATEYNRPSLSEP